VQILSGEESANPRAGWEGASPSRERCEGKPFVLSQGTAPVGFPYTPVEDRGVWFSWIELDHFREFDWE
jgi:hypothetical protein